MATSTYSRTRRICTVCNKRLPAGSRTSHCPGCLKTMADMRAARDGGECKTPHPELESRLLSFARRHEIGLPLFDGPRNDRAA